MSTADGTTPPTGESLTALDDHGRDHQFDDFVRDDDPDRQCSPAANAGQLVGDAGSNFLGHDLQYPGHGSGHADVGMVGGTFRLAASHVGLAGGVLHRNLSLRHR